jgi:type I restriction enzyme R subunit
VEPGGPEDIQRAVENAKGLGRFIRSLVGLDQQAVNAKFAQFLDGTTATANLTDFIGLIISYLTRHGAMDPRNCMTHPSPTTRRRDPMNSSRPPRWRSLSRSSGA